MISRESRACHGILTHWGQDKMAAILQTTLSSAFSLMKNVRISIEFSLNFVGKGSILPEAGGFPSEKGPVAWKWMNAKCDGLNNKELKKELPSLKTLV